MTDPNGAYDWDAEPSWSSAPKLRAPQPEPVRRTRTGKVAPPARGTMGKLYLSTEDNDCLQRMLRIVKYGAGLTLQADDSARVDSLLASLVAIKAKAMGDDAPF